MKKLFNAICAVVLGTVIFCSCHGSKSVINIDNIYGYSIDVTRVIMSKPDTLCNAQMDSVIKVDKLPQLNKWATSVFKAEDTNTNYTYKVLYDKTTKTTYTVKILYTGQYVLSKKVLEIR